MKILETIDLRLSTADKALAEDMIQMLVNENENSNEARVHLYRNNHIDTDYTIQIFNNKTGIAKTGSHIAQKIIFNLKNFGLINHNIWRKL